MTTQTLRANDGLLSNLAIGADDSESVLINVRVHVASGLAEALKDSTVSDWLTRACLVKDNHMVRLDSLVLQFPFVENMLVQHQDPLGNLTGTSLQGLEDKLDYKGYQCRLGIFLLNPQTADPSTRAILTPGIEALNHWNEGIRDHAFAWSVTDGDDVQEVTISEEQALALDAPFLSVVMPLKEIDNDPPIGEFSQPAPPFTSDIIEDVARITAFKIHNWYEAGVDDDDKRNEVHIVSRHLYTPNWGGCPATVGNHMRAYCFGGSYMSDREMASLPSSVLNTHINVNHFFNYLAYHVAWGMLTDNKHQYMNMYERDWWAWSYPLGSAYWWCGQVQLTGQMNNPSDFYLYNPPPSNFYWRRIDIVNMWQGWNNSNGGPQNPWKNTYGARHHGDIHPSNYVDIRIFKNCSYP